MAAKYEHLNHDEFMLRALKLPPIDLHWRANIKMIGHKYLQRTGCLRRYYGRRNTPLLGGFRHFLPEYIGFDSDVAAG